MKNTLILSYRPFINSIFQMGQIQSVQINGIVYEIYTNENRASIIKNKSGAEHIIIPHSLNYKNKEYIITSVSSKAFFYSIHTNHIQFADDSKIQIIGDSAFMESDIRSILIPPCVTKICGWAFCSCINLKQFEFSPNSKLQVIEEGMLANTSIEMITIPKEVTKICKEAFVGCKQLKHVEFSEDSELTTIEEEVFCSSPIESIAIPQKVVNLKDGWCQRTLKLDTILVHQNNTKYSLYGEKIIIGKSRPEIENYDELVFASRNIKNQFTFPESIIRICPYSFQSCKKLKLIEIPSNSELKIIDKYAFSESAIQRIDIPQNSKLQKIGQNAFAFTSITCFTIPQSVKKIDGNVFLWCDKLKIIEIGDYSEIEYIHPSAFSNSNLTLVMVQAKCIDVSVLFMKNPD